MSTRKLFIRSAYNYDRVEVSRETCFIPTGESLAIQSSKDECDINVIVRRFGVTGVMPQGVRAPTFQDFGDIVFDFQTAMNAVKAAKESFDSMPSQVRKRFANDPQEFVKFCSDPENLPEMRKLGLAIPEVLDKMVAPVKSQALEEGDEDGEDSVQSGDGSSSVGKRDVASGAAGKRSRAK